MVRRTAIIANASANVRGRCPECDATGARLTDTPLGRAMQQWADVVLTVTECDHADESPVAPARFEPPNSLVVDACPFCGKPHRHGALAPTPGSRPGPDAYGYRTAHCHPATGRSSYRLVPARGEA